ncbi:permease-like cell division protein FtsX [Nocardioides sp. BP30]|uniref:permease-like cell division protein FtsX n=1 Tax=Nocardioides sp. BP30 TaxID=3036374 RepID=UPI002468ECF2|nr:permease-like cell division protein FtsX [Nocardioides sp. BP30]WGL53512.1 permease-like cell division protein FtsX [Nocardioides sp. BP30]
MQLRYVFTELRQGLRRNLSMHLAVVLTLLVSLTLVGVGVLLHQEADKTAKQWGSQLQITVFLCNGTTDTSPSCVGAVTDAQKQAIEKVLHENKDIDSFRLESQQEAYDRIQHLNVPASSFKGPDPAIKVSDMPESYWITMKDPHQAASIKESVQGLDGVESVQDLHNLMGKILGTIDGLRNGAIVAAVLLVVAALLMVANTIRLAAFARRREIAIMRLVGASTLYIALPFLLEALVTAVVGVVLAGGALAAVMQFGVNDRLAKVKFDAWIGWHDYWVAAAVIAVLGVALTLLPTLLLTRKYLKV